MAHRHEQTARHRARATVWLFVLIASARCDKSTAPTGFPAGTVTLRVGVGQVALADPIAGLRQLVGILSTEALVNFNEDGRPRPWLADGWTVAADGRSLTVRLRQGVKFHDGSLLTAQSVVDVLRRSLPATMGPAYQNVAAISAPDDASIRIEFREASPFLVEALEAPILKSGASGIGTGPFKRVATSTSGASTEMVANPDHYLGRPQIDRIQMVSYPSVRAAWADLLRGRFDMLYEVGTDALESLQGSTDVSIHTFTRHYQYVVILNPKVEGLRPSNVRHALNAAVNRATLVRDGLNGYGVESSGPVWVKHWALSAEAPALGFDPQAAARVLNLRKGPTAPKTGGLRFTCLVPPDVTYERIALIVKRELEAVGVQMDLEQATPDRLGTAFASHAFDAVLVDLISGANLFRLYQIWHSGGSQNLNGYSSPAVDAALDSIYHATNDVEYRAAVFAFQQAIVNDPPAIFLAWGKRARAVNHRFSVPDEEDRDILPSIRLWQAVAGATQN